MMGIRIALVLLAVLTFVSSAQAVTIVSNFGAGDTFGGSATLVDGANISDNDIAVLFTPGTSLFFTTFEVPISESNDVNAIDVTLYADALGLPGAVIETINFVGPINNDFENPGIVLVSSNLNPLLTAGTPFWIGISEPDPNTRLFWRENSTGQTANSAQRVGSGPWEALTGNATPTFRVSGELTPPVHVPEPAAGLLLGAGAVGLVAWWRRPRGA